MTTGQIPAAAQPHLLVAPTTKAAFVDKDGILTAVGHQHLKQPNATYNGTSRTIPCSCSGTSTAIVLTPIPGGPLLTGYFDYEMFSFVASVTGDSGGWTATVVPATGSLPALKVYHASNAGPVTAGLNDMVAGNFYMYAYVDSLNSGVGGFFRLSAGA